MPDPNALILASASPRRSRLMREAGFVFETQPAPVDEHEELASRTPDHFVLDNARLKGRWVADRHPDALVLSADTTVALENRILNKPVDLEDARRMLSALAGRAHTVYTGVVFTWRNGDVEEASVVTSRVVFRNLSAADIDRYMTIVNPLDKAGGYGIQEGGEIIIDHFEGSFSNIMGLPMERVTDTLRALEMLNLFRNGRV